MIFDSDFLIAYDKITKRLSKANARAFVNTAAAAAPLLVSRVTWMEFGAGFATRLEAERKLGGFTILEFDAELWWAASRVKRGLSLRGLPIGTPDCMIAATAMAYAQPVVTLNVSHFSRVTGLRLITPRD